MPFRLRDDLHWCDCAGRVVLLDVEADRYFCLPPAANDAFLRLARGELQAGDPEHLRSLLARGMLTENQSCAPLRRVAPLEPAAADFLPEAQPWPGLKAVVGALASEIGLSWDLRRKRLAKVFKHAGRHKFRPQRCDRHPTRSLRTIVSASSFVSLFTGATDRCLVRALSVHSACRRRGLASKLVFGVRMNPFAAHCWVQFGQSVLVGDFEQVRLYTPILVLD